MPNTYTSYFNRLPKIKYDMNLSKIGARYDTVTNIFFRVRVIQEVLNNINSYFVAELEDGDTPEILAEKVYGDAGAGWIITIANNIVDPQWDWPLNYDEFQKYIIGKYGSVEAAKLAIHHYEMVIVRTIQPDNVTTERRYTVNGEKLTDNNLDIPYNYYSPHPSEIENITADFDSITSDTTAITSDNYLFSTIPDPWLQPGSLATQEYYNVYEIGGKTVTETINGEYTDCYTYEEEQNEQKRFIKIIKKEYYNQIMSEFDNLVGPQTQTIRTVR